MIALQIKLSPLSPNSIPQGKKVRNQFGEKLAHFGHFSCAISIIEWAVLTIAWIFLFQRW